MPDLTPEQLAEGRRLLQRIKGIKRLKTPAAKIDAVDDWRG